MNRFRLALASLLLLAVGFGGTITSTSASFTAAASTPANSVSTGSLPEPQPTAGPVTVGSSTLTWNAVLTGGATPAYSVTRSNSDGTDPTTVYTGTDTTYTDHGDIPAELKSRDIIAISAGGAHSLALDSEHNVYGWGLNDSGQVGTDTANRRKPTKITFPTGVTITSVVAGDSHSLALDSDHNVYAWGNNGSGQLGTDDTANRRKPTKITFPTGVTITSVAAGASHSLALDSDHNVYAWGNNYGGQVGIDGAITIRKPTKITFPTGVTITSVTAGASHSLALDSDHNVYAWGNNYGGQLGTDDTANRRKPTKITFPTGVTITSVTAGDSHSLALDSDHNVYAWGNNGSGQLGTDDTANRRKPTEITFPTGVTITSVTAGASHSLALDSDHNVYAWGNNFGGQVGTDGAITIRKPTKITFPTGVTITSITAGASHSLALDSDHNVYAWGNNYSGQLATGDSIMQRKPTRADFSYRACPARSTLLSDGETCSLRSNQAYRYTVTTTLGGWTKTSAPLTLTTKSD